MMDDTFRKSTYSADNGNCTEVALRNGDVLVRDSKAPGLGHIAFSSAVWAAFLSEVKKA